MSSRLQVLKLIELAVHPGTPSHEATAAAMAACRRIHKEGLLTAKQGEHVRPSEAPKGSSRTFDVVFLVLTETDVLYRLAKIVPPRLQSENVILLPKQYVAEVEFMTKVETRKIGWRGSRVIKRLAIDLSYFDDARSNGWDAWR